MSEEISLKSQWGETNYTVHCKFITPCLGTSPENQAIWRNYVATKWSKELKKEGLSEEEISAKLDAEQLEVADYADDATGKTVFLKDEIGYYVKAYMIRGFIRNAASTMKQFGAMKQLKSVVSKYLFVYGVEDSTKIYLAGADAKLEICERPLRASTPQGERTSISRSEEIPAETKFSFKIKTLDGQIPTNMIVKLLQYGELVGLGQWRNSGEMGRFIVTKLIKED